MTNIQNPQKFENCKAIIQNIRLKVPKQEDKNTKSFQISQKYDQCSEKILKVFITKHLMNMLLKVASETSNHREDAYKSAQLLVQICKQLLSKDDYFFNQIQQCVKEVTNVYEKQS